MTLRCLGYLRSQSRPHRILVVDNGSKEEDLSILRAALPPDTELLSLAQNRGFAGGMNAGLRVALAGGAEYVWLLNNDAFPEPDCLEQLMRFMEAQPRVAMTTPRLVGSDNREQPAGARFCWSKGENRTRLSADLTSPACDGTWLAGTALLVRSNTLARVGLFDPHYFAYWEDVDLSVRLMRAGHDLRAVPEAMCVHLGGFSSGGNGSSLNNYLIARNAFRFLRKHSPRCCFLGACVHTVNYWLTQAAILMARGRQASAEGILRGLRAGLLGETGSPKRLRFSIFGERLILDQQWRVCQLLGRLGRYVESSLYPATA
jgi:GT2 family glycosyltransferase